MMADETLVPTGAALAALPTLGRNTNTKEKEHKMQTAATLPEIEISMEQETNPWEAQASRFDEAARRLKLDDGIWKVAALSGTRDHRAHPGADG